MNLLRKLLFTLPINQADTEYKRYRLYLISSVNLLRKKSLFPIKRKFRKIFSNLAEHTSLLTPSFSRDYFLCQINCNLSECKQLSHRRGGVPSPPVHKYITGGHRDPPLQSQTQNTPINYNLTVHQKRTTPVSGIVRFFTYSFSLQRLFRASRFSIYVFSI